MEENVRNFRTFTVVVFLRTIPVVPLLQLFFVPGWFHMLGLFCHCMFLVSFLEGFALFFE